MAQNNFEGGGQRYLILGIFYFESKLLVGKTLFMYNLEVHLQLLDDLINFSFNGPNNDKACGIQICYDLARQDVQKMLYNRCQHKWLVDITNALEHAYTDQSSEESHQFKLVSTKCYKNGILQN